LPTTSGLRTSSHRFLRFLLGTAAMANFSFLIRFTLLFGDHLPVHTGDHFRRLGFLVKECDD
jgi:hypothetical protein